MKPHELKKTSIFKQKSRIGRGISAGGGKTAGRGTKGQKSRSGYNLPRKFEGGQTPLIMRSHKLLGFKSHKPKSQLISLSSINKNFKDGEMVSKKTLIEKGLITGHNEAKILNNGKLEVSVYLDGLKVSKEAAKKFLPKEEKSSKKVTTKK